MAAVFYEGSTELATLTNTFSVNDTATDPDAVTLVVTDPTGEQTTYDGEITHPDVGEYTIDVACTVAGVWSYVWVGTGIASDVAAGTWTVFDTDLHKLYCSLEELKSRLRIPTADTADDFELKLALAATSRWIDGHCGRRFHRVAETRTYVARDPYRIDVDDLVSVTSLKTDAAGDGTFETTWSAADYQLLPHNPTAAAEQRPYTRIQAVGSYLFPIAYARPARADRVQVVGVFGWPEVPAPVRSAALALSAETFKRKDTFTNAGGFGEFGPTSVRRDPQVLDLLAPYRELAGFA